MVRQARAAERRALSALARYQGRGDLPPVTEDPLRHKEAGKKLLTWRADYSRGVCDLTLVGGRLLQQRVTGKEVEGMSCEFHDPLPEKGGWQVAIEVAKGRGIYRVLQQPTAANGWTVVLQVDDEWSRHENETELVVWAVPAVP